MKAALIFTFFLSTFAFCQSYEDFEPIFDEEQLLVNLKNELIQHKDEPYSIHLLESKEPNLINYTSIKYPIIFGFSTWISGDDFAWDQFSMDYNELAKEIISNLHPTCSGYIFNSEQDVDVYMKISSVKESSIYYVSNITIYFSDGLGKFTIPEESKFDYDNNE